MSMKFTSLAISNPNDLIFGISPKPVKTRRGLVLGGGHVYPEVNLTVPEGTVINRSTMDDLARRYADAVRDILRRAVEMHCEGLTIEFETLLEMTLDPVIGTEIVRRMSDVCDEFQAKHGLKSEIRLTPNDSRDFDRPPLMRNSRHLENMFKLFEDGARAGGDLLSIESTGGKEVCDDALTMCDIRAVIFSQAVMGVRDMRFLWKHIVDIARKTGRVAGGDTACGFGNTAMVLAEKRYIPQVFASAVRAATIPRSLVAIEEGATGPHKDCGYEGVFIKAITGIPIAMEGKTAACAHLSPVGNIAAAACDLWSNESVQNIKLLAGMAPTVYFEQLEYDCRLMNTALKQDRAQNGKRALILRDLMCDSDTFFDPQALILTPKNVITISQEVVSAPNHLVATKNAVLKTIDIIEAGYASGELIKNAREQEWIPRIREEVQSIPNDESKFVEEILPTIDTTHVLLGEYGL